MGLVPERKEKMRMETENAVRSIVNIDPEITREMIEQAIDVLRGRTEEVVLVHNVRFRDAQEILKVSRRTLRHYLDSGYLDRVFGGGRRAIGVTRESLLRFMTRRRVEHRGKKGTSVYFGTGSNDTERPWAREIKR